MQAFLDSPIFTWIILPVLIFLSRIADMSMDTMRIMMIGRGRKSLAALLGFFEVSLWLLVARQVIAHLPNAACFFAYAGGFATGNYVGMWIEERMASGAQMVRITIPHNGGQLVEALKAAGFGLTTFAAQGAKGPVDVIHSVVMRSEVKRVVDIIHQKAPKAFFTIEDVRQVNEGVFPPARSRGIFQFLERK